MFELSFISALSLRKIGLVISTTETLSLSYLLYPLVASLHALFIGTIFMFCTTGIELVSKDLGKTYTTKS